jgi:hypothetical protein
MERKITVCAECKRATCWWGLFYCEKAKTAGTVEMTVSDLRGLGLEHPSYWTVESERRHTGAARQL